MEFGTEINMDEIDIAENHIDSVLNDLKIFTLPFHIALFIVLEMYEAIHVALSMSNLGDRSEANYRMQTQSIVRLRHSLGFLIPRLFSKCPHRRIKFKEIANLRNLATNRIYQRFAKQSIQYCQRYSWIAYHITCYRQGWFRGKIDGREITFTYPEGVDIPQSLMHHRVKSLHEGMAIDQNLMSEVYNEPLDELDETLIAALKHKNPEQFLNSIPDKLFLNLEKLTLASMPSPTIDKDIQFDQYTIGEFYKFWISLVTLMFSYHHLCIVKYHSNPKQSFKSLVVITSLDNIAELVSKRTDSLSVETAKKITEDLVFDATTQRPDIQIRCFFPLNENLVLLSPRLIMTSNWEVCLLRNWANMSPSKYGEIVACKKERLTEDFAALFEQADIKKATRRKIINSQRQAIGDIDLALFDKSIGYLILIEIKWLIEPDSFQEESHAKKELGKGIEQIIRIQELALDNKQYLIKTLFPNNEVVSNEVTETQYILISRGSLDMGIDTSTMQIPLLDYELTYDILSKDQNNNLKMRFQQVLDVHNDLKKTVQGEASHAGMKLAGYLWRTPALNIPQKRGETKTKTLHRNSPCSCGSDLPYGDCCQVIEDLPEEGIGYPLARQNL